MMLLLLLAKGWAITRMMLTRRVLLFTLWGLYSTLILTLYFWNMVSVWEAKSKWEGTTEYDYRIAVT